MRILDARTDRREVRALAERRLEADPAIEQRVREILEQVRSDGDEAVTTLTRQYDCRFIDSLGLRVSDRDIERSYSLVSRKFLTALRLARTNIERFHRKQLPKSWQMRRAGLRLGLRYRALSRVGIYVPGGKAAYPSTVIMNAVPAAIAGVPDIVMTTPCGPDGRLSPEVLVAASESGVREIYRIGGAQAIGALAYGTESIHRVDKITGPGNAYVAAAKRLVFGVVGIDMIAGPTEVVVVADASAHPEYVAADLLAQAEHDELASPLCVATTRHLAERIVGAVTEQLESTPRSSIARISCDRHGVVIVSGRSKETVDIVNALAPEHVELMVRYPRRMAEQIANAGAIFVGPYSTEALGDYVAGPNHTLPTSGSARFSSPLGVMDYMKASSIIEAGRAGFDRLAPHVQVLAGAEGLAAHAASVEIRRRVR
ncbi:MAG TPA: histidinol dehydrogenase [Bacteroidota bacterium]|nr:histidinol dehydrogenase [Bacteroidota bacterium]